MNFRADLAGIITEQFVSTGIHFDPNLDVDELAVSYFQALTRIVAEVPRTVHFSEQIHSALGALTREIDSEIHREAKRAWGAAFHLHWLFSEGKNVNAFLSRKIVAATGKKSRDGLLFDYGMHHFHLNDVTEQDGFIKRSRYLLYAVVTQEDVYFVDVREHPKGADLGWVRQDLVKIVNANWPELLERNAILGVLGDTVTDEQKQELRRKNVNHLSPVKGKVFLPLGGGTMGDGSSLRCRWEAMRLMQEIDDHQRILESQHAALIDALRGNGIPADANLKLDLELLENLDLPPESLAALNAENCLSTDLCQMGFCIVEHTTKSPIVVGL